MTYSASTLERLAEQCAPNGSPLANPSLDVMLEVAAALRSAVARVAELEAHMAKHFPARGSVLGDYTVFEERAQEVIDAACEWRVGQFFVADLVAAVDAYKASPEFTAAPSLNAKSENQHLRTRLAALESLCEEACKVADGLVDLAAPGLDTFRDVAITDIADIRERLQDAISKELDQ